MCAQHIEHLAQTIRNDHNPARAFEQMLAHVNEDFARIAPELDIKKEKCHAIFAVCAKNQLFLSGFGNLLAIFLHKTADRRFSIYELHTQLNDEKTTWDKPCSVVLDGELHEGDVFYVATHIPANLLSTAALQDILVTLPAKGALERLEGFIPPAMPFAGVAIQVSSKERVANVRVNPLGSLDMLQKTQDRTAEVLGERTHQKKEGGTLLSPTWMGRTDAKAIMARTGNIAGNALGIILKAIKTLGKTIAEYGKKQINKQKRVTKKGSSFSKSLSVATASPLAIVLTIGAILATLIGGSLLWKNTQANQDQKELFAKTSSEIKESIAQAEGSLIYNNTQGATQTLQGAQELLKELYAKNTEQETLKKQLEQQVQLLQEKAQGVTRFSPTALASLPEDKKGVTGIIGINTYLLAETGEIYRFNGLENNWEQQSFTSGAVGSPKIASEENNATLLIIDSNGQLVRYNQETQTLNPMVSGVNKQKKPTDLAFYNNTLYVIDAETQQIIRMRPQGDGYEAGTPWITARSNDIQDAKAITIDGNIYVLTKDAVRVFFAGKEQTWNMGELTTPLKNPVDIFTTTESKELSILDPENKRIIVINKENGAIIAQYVSDDLQNAIALHVDEKENTIKILTQSGIMQFTPNHLIQ